MANWKGRGITFKVPYEENFIINPRVLHTAIEGEIVCNIIAFQDLGSSEYLVELSALNGAESVIEGFDLGDSHVICHPPHGQSVNVSIMDLQSYIADKDV